MASIVTTKNRKDFPPMAKTHSNLAVVPLPPQNPTVSLLYTAGVVGVPQPSEPPTAFPKDDFKQQTINCLLNIKACLALGGGTPRDIVKITFYVVDYDPSMRDVLISILEDFFADYEAHAPPSTLLGIKNLAQPWFKVEIDAVAAVAAVAV